MQLGASVVSGFYRFVCEYSDNNKNGCREECMDRQILAFRKNEFQ